MSPVGFDGTDVLALFALAIGVGAIANLLLNRTDPVPVLVVIVVLVGVIGPFVDLATAMALAAVVVAVVATGSLLIERVEGVVALIALGLISVALRPLFDTLEYLPVDPVATSVAVPWIVSLVAVLTTALAFRALRDHLLSKEAHQARVNDVVEHTAYQIRAPLSAAIGYAYLLRSELGDGEATEYADGVIRRGWEVSLGLDDLMIVSRSETSELELLGKPVEIDTALSSCLDNVIGARVKLRSFEARGLVLGDPVRVRHILRHLVSNAVLHGGSDISIWGRSRGSTYELRIHDNGTPLDLHQRERMFEPFVRLAPDETKAGRGVGLTVSRILACAMGGDVRVEAGSNGNMAILTLPRPQHRSGQHVETLPEGNWATLRPA